MPNWNHNVLTISGPEEDLEHFKKEIPQLTLEAMKPIPGGEWDYDWCVQNWGTKWDIEPQEHPNMEEDWFIEYDEYWAGEQEKVIKTMLYEFETAWSPPFGAIHGLAKTFPNLLITLTYSEAGIGFCGYQEWFKDDESVEFYCNNVYADEAISRTMQRGLMQMRGG